MLLFVRHRTESSWIKKPSWLRAKYRNGFLLDDYYLTWYEVWELKEKEYV
jgi:hypothetical protein